MSIVTRFLSVVAVFALAGSVNAQSVHIIPEPVSVKEQPGHFTLTPATTISASVDSFASTGAWLSEYLHLQQGKGGKHITLAAPADRNRLGAEGYALSVTPTGIRLTANTSAGIFYGMQTLLQLIPADIAPGQAASIPCVEITDYPRFGWRGLMLDVSRHFFTKTEVEHYIDDMVRYKFNTLHLHLSDDQGWRIEIKSLPQLTQHGAWRVSRTGRWGEYLPPLANEPTPYGGFYTQDDMRDIIKYAEQRHVTILPEIDIPAHSLAFISSYPNLSCTQLPYSVNPGARPPIREDNALCIGNDSVYMMLDKIITEIAALFPNPYIHIGGDEAYKGFWATCPKCTKRMHDENLKDVDELQSYFVRRIEKLVNSKGKKLIGWDEIMQGGLAASATVMSWRGMSGGVAAAKMGHPVVMTPWDFVYIDLYQGDPTVEPPTYGICRLKDSYTWDPVPDSVDEKLILGGQGNLWSESVPTYRHAQYMTWPRGLALAEVYWSPKTARNWDDFTKRVEAEFKRMDAAGIKYARSAFQPLLVPRRLPGGDLTVALTAEVPGLDLYYSFDQTNPDNTYPKYDGTPLKFPMGANQINVITYRDGHPIGVQIGVKKDELIRRAGEAHHVY